MRTYIVEDITIHIGAQVVSVHYGGKTITPKEKKDSWAKRTVKEYWKNNYFRNHTKTYLSIKAAEFVSRCIGLHGVYLVAREYIWPNIATIIIYLKMIDFWNVFVHFDIGFVIGVITTMIGVYSKRMILHERGAKA